jgi:hypothetical protein
MSREESAVFKRDAWSINEVKRSVGYILCGFLIVTAIGLLAYAFWVVVVERLIIPNYDLIVWIAMIGFLVGVALYVLRLVGWFFWGLFVELRKERKK